VTVVPALSPSGRLHLQPDVEAAPLPPDRAAGIASAFARGSGDGLLHLGLAEVETKLPPAFAYWRDWAREFVTAVHHQVGSGTHRDLAAVAPPLDRLAASAAAAPPMPGAEYLSRGLLFALWNEMDAALAERMAGFTGSVAEFLHAENPIWSLVGRVCFHLAENKTDHAAPFAFLATYTTGLTREARVSHRPLGRALEEYAGERNRRKLLSLLEPVGLAAKRSAFVRELVDSGEIYHPLAWTPAEAYRLLKETPEIEAAGVTVRVPDWWRAGAKARPRVQLTVGEKRASVLGLDALLDFSVQVSLDGEKLSEKEIRELLAGADGLRLLKGRWVEIDRAKLEQLLKHWRGVERTASRDGVSFIEGLRLLAGAPTESAGTMVETSREWMGVKAGEWLGEILAGLRGPEGLAAARPGAALKTTLRPYQEIGVRWLRFAAETRLGVCLADDMGLGKTIQMLGLLLLLSRSKPDSRGCERAESRATLLVAPASLIANWRSEIERFAPDLSFLVAHPSETPTEQLASPELDDLDLVITTYGFVHRLPWIAKTRWRMVVLDEAQAIKNPSARQTRAVKALRSSRRVALTGTPIENRLGDLWSLFDFLNPGLLGSAREFTAFTRRLSDDTQSFEPLRNLVRPYILRRLKTDRNVIADLPEKTEMKTWCALTKPQAALYQAAVRELESVLSEEVEGIRRKGIILAFLMRFKQICNHPSHWLADGRFDSTESGKFLRLG